MRRFDKWWFGKAINRAERRGRRQAEERIIKLLEDYGYPNLIELIKGENK